MAKKVNDKTEKIKSSVPGFKTFYSKNNRPFRLSGIAEDTVTIKWLDTGLFESFPYPKIEPYLKTKNK